MARFSYTFRYIRDHVIHSNALFHVAHERIDESRLKTVSNHRGRLSHREHCKDDCLPSLDGMASLSFQSFWGYTKLTHNTLERFRIKIIKPRLHAASLFWTLCTTDFIKGKPGPLKVYQTHVHFLYRCWWMQRWQAWLSREWNLYKHRWVLWMCLQRWIPWRRTQLFR